MAVGLELNKYPERRKALERMLDRSAPIKVEPVFFEKVQPLMPERRR